MLYESAVQYRNKIHMLHLENLFIFIAKDKVQ